MCTMFYFLTFPPLPHELWKRVFFCQYFKVDEGALCLLCFMSSPPPKNFRNRYFFINISKCMGGYYVYYVSCPHLAPQQEIWKRVFFLQHSKVDGGMLCLLCFMSSPFPPTNFGKGYFSMNISELKGGYYV